MNHFLKLILLIGAIILTSCKGVEKSFPDKKGGAEADTLAKNIMASVNVNAWNEIEAIEWTFNGKAKHLWDIKRSLAKVEWKDYKVLLDIGKKEGLVWQNEERLQGDEKDKLVEKAWHKWANDSYWLNPIPKLFDEGTKRYKVDYEGKNALLITYHSGGITPGDSYLWILDDNYRPIAWKMWVDIIPLKGMKISWEDWQTLDNGALISTKHKALGLSLNIGDIKSSVSMNDLYVEDPFALLFN